jgi:hypothetical protein
LQEQPVGRSLVPLPMVRSQAMRSGKTFALVTALFLASPSLTWAAGVSVEEASDEQKKQASEAFQAGDAAFDILKYAEALEHFKRSYEAVKSPNSRLMVARCLLELGRLDEAYDEYSGVIGDASESEAYEAAGKTAEKERAALLNRLAWLDLDLKNLPEGAQVEIGGRVRERADLKAQIALTPGLTVVTATTDDGKKAVANVHVAAGRKASVALVFGKTITVGTPPPPEEKEEDEETEPEAEEMEVTSPDPVQAKPSSLKPWAFVAGGVGLAGGGAFAAFGILSGNHYKDLEGACTDGVCPAESQDDIDKGKQYQLFANIGLGVGVAGVATSVVLFILDAKRQGPVEVNVGPSSVTIGGHF